MSKYKNLDFSADETELDAEVPSRAFVVKVFHLYQRRNEWVNWDGDNDLVKRSGLFFRLSIQEATDSA